MNNYQWLLQMDGAERKAWFDAEHVETEERALDGDTESESINTDAVSERYATAFKWLDRLDYGKGGVIDNSLCDTPEQGEVVMPLESWREHLATESENEDSRDKLEADVRKIAEAYNMDEQRHGTERFEHELYYSIIHLLDRQAAITEREVCAWIRGKDAEHDERIHRVAELQQQVDELTAERDKLKGQVFTLKCECEDLENELHELTAERDNLKANNQQLHTLAGEQAATIDWLTAERDNLKDDLIDERGKLNRKMNALREVTRDYRNERDHYREKFGKCIDHADAIHALMDDEGMA